MLDCRSVVFQLDLLLKAGGGADTSTFVMNGEWDLLGECNS